MSEKKFDLRTLDLYLSKGELSHKEYEDYLNNLKDDEGNYDLINLQDEENSLTSHEDSELAT